MRNGRLSGTNQESSETSMVETNQHSNFQGQESEEELKKHKLNERKEDSLSKKRHLSVEEVEEQDLVDVEVPNDDIGNSEVKTEGEVCDGKAKKQLSRVERPFFFG